MVSENLVKELEEKKRIEDALCVEYKVNTMSAVGRFFNPLLSMIKNRSKNGYISIANDNLYVFHTKGYFVQGSVVDENTLQVIKFSSINSISKKDVDIRSLRSLQFSIKHSSGVIKGYIDNSDDRKVFNKIVEKIGK